MPELPEVETMRRGIQCVAGRMIRAAGRVRCRQKPIVVSPAPSAFTRRVADRRIVRVDRAGKRVVLVLDSKDRIVIEPRMTGLVLLADPPDAKYLRFRIELAGLGPRELFYWDRRGLGSVRLFSPEQYEDILGTGQLGPDALAIELREFRSRLGSSRRAIKVAMLDQRAVAGIGNLYASEILHVAKIHPGRACNALRPAQWTRLHAAMAEVLTTAIHYEGSTLGDGTYRNTLNRAGSYQNHHRVYALAGKPCIQCRRGRIVRTVLAQRATFHCPACQR